MSPSGIPAMAGIHSLQAVKKKIFPLFQGDEDFCHGILTTNPFRVIPNRSSR